MNLKDEYKALLIPLQHVSYQLHVHGLAHHRSPYARIYAHKRVRDDPKLVRVPGLQSSHGYLASRCRNLGFVQKHRSPAPYPFLHHEGGFASTSVVVAVRAGAAGMTGHG